MTDLRAQDSKALLEECGREIEELRADRDLAKLDLARAVDENQTL